MSFGDVELDLDESVADFYDIGDDDIDYFPEVENDIDTLYESVEEHDLIEFDDQFSEGSNEDVEVVGEDVLGVGQAEFAYLDDELMDQLDFEGLETAVGPCYAVAVLDNDTGDMALIHADKDKVDQIRNGLNRASNKLSADFDEAKLVTNERENREFIGVYNMLERKFDEVEAKSGEGIGTKTLGVNKDGFYTPSNPALPQSDEIENMMALNRRRLKDRTDAAIEDWYQEQWDSYENENLPEPISEKWVKSDDGSKKYARRIHYPQNNEIEANYAFRFEIGDAQLEDFETEFEYDIKEIGGQRVIKIKSEHPIEQDRKKVKEVNKEAAQIYNELTA